MCKFLPVSAFVFLAGVVTFAQSITPVPRQCGNRPFPFAQIAVPRPFDAACGIAGKPTSPQNSQTQNRVKNNFCAQNQNNVPVTIVPDDLIQLQHKHNIPSGTGLEPANRAQLQQFGEGKLVRMKAFLIEAHHADLGTGESVNCNGATEEQNDIHIAFGSQPNTQECNSVSAEISPHFRPTSWNEIGHFEVFDNNTKQFVVNPQMAALLQAHPYRITGQVFFDASHAPCPCGTTHCNPIRSSVWEIHPIYNIEVCKPGAQCNVNNDADWVSFDTWWNTLVKPQPLKPPHSHEAHESQ
jgi:hypothetical protein